MDFESPDVEKDFPGLYASESGRKSNESDFSDGGDHEKPSKKDLLGRRKEKKEKKDRGYAALEGESSPEEDTDTKSPSKSKKTKSFKFPTKSKEKREKSRDKEKVLDDSAKHKELNEKERKKEKEREKEREREKKEKERKEKEKREKLKEKDKEKEEKAKFKLESREKLKDEKKDKTKDKEKERVKEKDKEKVKEKDKDKKDRKLTKVPSTVTAGVPFEEIFTLGVALPIFGVPLQQSVERSRCHDDTGLPLVVRDSIDYLQAHGLKSNQIYRTEPDKIKLQQLRKLFTDRGPTFPYHWDVAIACSMLKGFISELPESILTQELHGQFEQAAAIAEPQREATMLALIGKLPACNHSLVGWLMRHFENVVANEQCNHANIQTIQTAMGAALNMSLNLLTYLVTKSEKLFPNVQLTKYVPPLANIPADFPESAQEISSELRKQESLLNQIHAEMHAGFITPARDHQLWEAQRIVTQLKRKLRSVQKLTDPHGLSQQQQSVEQDDDISRRNSQTTDTNHTDTELKSPNDAFDKESPKIPEASFPIQEAAFEPSFPAVPEVAFEPSFPIVPETAAFEPTFPIAEAVFEPTFPIAEAAFEPSFPIAEAAFEPSFPNVPETFEPDFTNIPEASFEQTFSKLPASDTAFELNFNTEFEDNFEFRTDLKDTPDHEIPPAEPVQEKPKFTEKELKILRLELENAEYLQLKSLLQAKINSEQFEIVKLRSHVALKNKQECLQNKENKENLTPEDQELKQRLIKENGVLEQKRLNLINQIFQERVACIQLKIELAMKEILSKS